MACQRCEGGRKLNSPTPSSKGHTLAFRGWRISRTIATPSWKEDL